MRWWLKIIDTISAQQTVVIVQSTSVLFPDRGTKPLHLIQHRRFLFHPWPKKKKGKRGKKEKKEKKSYTLLTN